ncbi:MAG TPA: glycosyltransferase [Alphaproteobacteria bacterium]|nr:hypothetical protein [Rhodospirillaceae bacterium]HRJ12826.1 glycosyltransferase [Alphaproteobacteria bacterium]
MMRAEMWRMTDTAILLPYYRRATALAQTLASLNQEKEAFELIIVDDGSPEPLSIQASHYDYPIKIIHLPKNLGITGALNQGLEYILSQHYQYVARIDAGDRWVPGRLAAQRNFLATHPDYGFVGSCVRYIHSDGSFARHWDLPLTDKEIRHFAWFNNPMFHPAVMMRAETLRRAGFYSEKYPAAEDYEYFRRLLKYGKAANLPDRYLDCEIGVPGESISVDNYHRQIKSVIRAQMHYFNFLQWRAYAGLSYKVIHLYMPGLADWLKKHFRKYF